MQCRYRRGLLASGRDCSRRSLTLDSAALESSLGPSYVSRIQALKTAACSLHGRCSNRRWRPTLNFTLLLTTSYSKTADAQRDWMSGWAMRLKRLSLHSELRVACLWLIWQG